MGLTSPNSGQGDMLHHILIFGVTFSYEQPKEVVFLQVPIHQHTPIHRLAARHFSPIKVHKLSFWGFHLFNEKNPLERDFFTILTSQWKVAISKRDIPSVSDHFLVMIFTPQWKGAIGKGNILPLCDHFVVLIFTFSIKRSRWQGRSSSSLRRPSWLSGTPLRGFSLPSWKVSWITFFDMFHCWLLHWRISMIRCPSQQITIIF